MRVIERERKIAIITALCNGMSLRSTSRIFDTHRTAIQNLLVRVGANCEHLMAERMYGLGCRYLEADEIWTFCGKKERRLKADNLTIRTFQRRFTRLALGFSRKIENLRAAVALQMAYWNFVWIPRTLRITPAMAAGVTDHVWEVLDLLGE